MRRGALRFHRLTGWPTVSPRRPPRSTGRPARRMRASLVHVPGAHQVQVDVAECPGVGAEADFQAVFVDVAVRGPYRLEIPGLDVPAAAPHDAAGLDGSREGDRERLGLGDRGAVL